MPHMYAKKPVALEMFMNGVYHYNQKLRRIFLSHDLFEMLIFFPFETGKHFFLFANVTNSFVAVKTLNISYDKKPHQIAF